MYKLLRIYSYETAEHDTFKSVPECKICTSIADIKFIYNLYKNYYIFL